MRLDVPGTCAEAGREVVDIRGRWMSMSKRLIAQGD
jgi:hypothetical protein